MAGSLGHTVEDARPKIGQAGDAGDPVFLGVPQGAIVAAVGVGGHRRGSGTGVRRSNAGGRTGVRQHQFGCDTSLRLTRVLHHRRDRLAHPLHHDAAGEAAEASDFLDEEGGVGEAAGVAAVGPRDGLSRQAGVGQSGDIIPLPGPGTVNPGGLRRSDSFREAARPLAGAADQA